MINSVYQLNRIFSSFWRSRRSLLLLGNYWVRLSKISHELSKAMPVLPSTLADNTDTKFGISRHPAKPNSIIVLLNIFQTICKQRHLSLQKRKPHGRGAWKLDRLELEMICATSVAVIGSLRQLMSCAIGY